MSIFFFFIIACHFAKKDYSEYWQGRKTQLIHKKLIKMNIKELGLEELTVSEKKETRGGLAPIVYVGLVAAGLLIATFDLHGSGGSMHP